MIIAGGKRCCGKTTELINIASTNEIPIIVLNKQRGNEIKAMAIKQRKKVETITLKEMSNITGLRIEKILIDDLEDILNEIFYGRKIVVATTSAPFYSMKKIGGR